MWWEWEGGGGEAPREETPVDFDFISLLAKPKVRRERDGDATPHQLSPRFCHGATQTARNLETMSWRMSSISPLSRA